MKRFELVLLGTFSLDVSRKKRGTLLGTLLSRKTIYIKNQFLSLSLTRALIIVQRNCQYVPNGSDETIEKDPFLLFESIRLRVLSGYFLGWYLLALNVVQRMLGSFLRINALFQESNRVSSQLKGCRLETAFRRAEKGLSGASALLAIVCCYPCISKKKE